MATLGIIFYSFFTIVLSIVFVRSCSITNISTAMRILFGVITGISIICLVVYIVKLIVKKAYKNKLINSCKNKYDEIVDNISKENILSEIENKYELKISDIKNIKNYFNDEIKVISAILVMREKIYIVCNEIFFNKLTNIPLTRQNTIKRRIDRLYDSKYITKIDNWNDISNVWNNEWTIYVVLVASGLLRCKYESGERKYIVNKTLARKRGLLKEKCPDCGSFIKVIDDTLALTSLFFYVHELITKKGDGGRYSLYLCKNCRAIKVMEDNSGAIYQNNRRIYFSGIKYIYEDSKSIADAKAQVDLAVEVVMINLSMDRIDALKYLQDIKKSKDNF